MTEAAAAPLAAGTAWTVLARLALPAGSRLLVLGASGGVGLFLLQLAARQGIEVIAVGRQAMHPQMLALGAASCVDYTVENVTRRTLELADGPVDAVADLVGGRALADVIGTLRDGGQAAAIATPELDLDPLLDANITFHGVLLADDGQRTRDLAALLTQGVLRPVVSHRLPLAEAAQAHRILADQHPGGKIVLTVAAPGPATWRSPSGWNRAGPLRYPQHAGRRPTWTPPTSTASTSGPPSSSSCASSSASPTAA
jgi:NADPH:quinone reductase-like Zn-dependent oxidoreductase